MGLVLVTIIVPVFNAENTLKRCVNSILSQEYQNTEIILVDDGSTDNSLAICLEYARKDSRVSIVAKENTGVSHSRNIGISSALGKYLQFVDSDDWITENATKVLVEKAEEAQTDMVIANFYRVINGRKAEKGNIKNKSIMDKKEIITHMMKEPANFYYGVMWNKLYRRDIITAHRIVCCTDINWCEDYLFNLDYIRYAETFVAVNVPVYYYVKTKNSLVSKECNLNSTIRMKIKLFESYKELFESMELYEEHRVQMVRFFISYARDNNVGYVFQRKGKNTYINQKTKTNKRKIN